MTKNRFPFICFALILVSLVLGCVPETFQFSSEFGKSGSGKGEFLAPTDLALMKNGDLLVADSGNNRVQVLSATDGMCKMSFGEYGTTGFKLQGISGVAVNALSGEIAVCDLKGHKVVKFDAAGNPILRFTDKVRCPVDVEFDKLGNMYVLMTKQPGIFKFDPRGRYLDTIGGKGKAAFVFATNLLFKNDHFYVTDYGSRRVVKMTPAGEVVKEITQKGEFEPLKGPGGIYVDDQENFFVLDLGEVPVSMINKDGNLISRIGAFGKEPGQFLFPRGIVARDSGEVLILDYTRNVILSFKRMAK